MATIALISLYDRNAYGLRLLSAELHRAGHQCALIFLKPYRTRKNYRLTLEADEYPWIGINKHGRPFKYATNSPITDADLDCLRQTLETIQPGAIGLTVTTPLRIHNARVTRFLKQHFRAPIVWGGYDPTVNTAECLSLCDYVCVGEGDQAILEMAKRLDADATLDNVSNFAWIRGGALHMCPKAPLESNLDRYPLRDDSPVDKYFIDNGRVVTNYAVINDKEPGVYQAMSARGCPYRCSYCCEATFKDLYAGEKFLRRRSPDDFVAELAFAKARFSLKRIVFEDEIFAMNLKWLEAFVPLYLEHVRLPFTAYIYPCNTIDRILPLLKTAGLDYCCLALESGSERINQLVFERVYNRALFLKTAAICRDLSIAFYTDVITYCPYELEDDLRRTLDVLLAIGGNFDMCINKLFVLPGSRLADQMQRDGVSSDDRARDALFDYYCRLFWIASFSPSAARIIRCIELVGLFRRRPALLDPSLVEMALAPARWLRRACRLVRSRACRSPHACGSGATRAAAMPICR